MAKTGFITLSGSFDEPISHFRVAMLTVATALSVIVLVLLLDVPPTQHAIKIDVSDANYLPDPISDRPVRVLEIRADGSMTYGGAPVADFLALRDLVDVDQQALPIPLLRIEPAPDLRYEEFLEVLAVIRYANVHNYCIDFDVERRPGRLKCGPPAFLE